MSDQTIGEALQALRMRSGLSLREVAEGAGYSGPSSVQAFFASHYDPPALDNIVARRLASAMTGRGAPAIREEEVLALSAFSPTERETAAAPRPSSTIQDNRVAVIKTSDIGRRAWQVSERLVSLEAFHLDVNTVVALENSPPGVVNPNDTFIFHMTGDALAPRYYSGEPVFFESWRTPSRGDFVVLILKEKLSEHGMGVSPQLNALAGQIVRRAERGFLMRQFTPARSAWVPADAVSALFRIMPWAQVCGLSYA
jgi:transcriptional regulator with XRE-family HTH domain